MNNTLFGNMTAKSNLLKTSPKAFQFLHEVFGIDFTKPYVVIEGYSKFTFKSIEKQILDIYPDYKWNHHVGGLFMTNNCSIMNKSLYFVKIKDLDFGMKLDCSNLSYYNNNIDYFYAKYQFNERRMTYSGIYTIVVQNSEYTTKVEPRKNIDLHQRVIVNPKVEPTRCRSNNGIYLSCISLILGDNSMHEFKYEPFNFYRNHFVSADINDYIDKSGYILIKYREDLYNRFKQMQRDRRKAEADSADFLDRQTKVIIEIDNKKYSLAKKVENAPMLSETITDLGMKIRDLGRIIKDFNRHCRIYDNKEFSSVEEIKRSISRIEKDLEELVIDE